MSTDLAYSAVRAYLEANWTATPLAWENEPPPYPEPPEPWVLVEISGNIWDQESIGAGERTDNRWQEAGTIWLHVMVPVNSGSLIARQHATALANLFRGGNLDDIEFRAISVGLGRPGDEDGTWWTLPVSVEWLKG